MAHRIMVYKTPDFLRHTAKGTIDLARSIQAVHDLARVANFHRDHDILLDLRETVVQGGAAEAIQLASEFVRLREAFRNRIAVVIPDEAQRIAKAEFMRACMHLEGFRWEFFMAYEDALDWLSEITVLDALHGPQEDRTED
jgi:hypothetical protein